MNSSPLSSSQLSPLLTLPLEIRLLILTPLLTSPTTNLRISSLFIRDNYINKFMTQQHLGIHPNLLRVCRQLHLECAPILYSQPLWRAACRLDSLRSQIGAANFTHIRRLECDSDDLVMIAGSLAQNPSSITATQHGSLPESKLMVAPFSNLELLVTEGYQAAALSSYATRRARFEAIRLCKMAQCILDAAPNLAVLVQRSRLSKGKSDAIDMTMGRVRWRFLRKEGAVDSDEAVVDIPAVIAVLENLIMSHEHRGQDEHAMWRTGQFRQYPHLVEEVTGT